MPVPDVTKKASVPRLLRRFVYGRRLFYKDYLDLYFLLHDAKATLVDIIALAEKEFGGDFNDRLFLGQLVSLSDTPTQKIDFLRDLVSRETVEQFLITTVKEFAL